MSGILFIAPFLAFLTALAVSFVVRFLISRRGSQTTAKVAGYAIALLVFPLVCLFFLQWIPSISTYSGIGVSPQVSNGHLRTFDVPTTATNIDYRTCIYDGLTDAADFDIDETEFIKWMAAKKREPIAFSVIDGRVEWADGEDRIVQDVPRISPVTALLARSSGDVQIEKGYYFDDYGPGLDDSGVTIVYDSVKGRAYVRGTTF